MGGETLLMVLENPQTSAKTCYSKRRAEEEACLLVGVVAVLRRRGGSRRRRVVVILEGVVVRLSRVGLLLLLEGGRGPVRPQVRGREASRRGR